jgi:predicted alpha/beta-hydrolase family hydrolase
MRKFELETPSGPARVHLHPATSQRAGLLLGHGAGGGIGAPDLVAVTEVAVDEGVTVALVEQPYRVAGRRSPPTAGHLDATWVAVAARMRERELSGLPLLIGGRSSGARVACRTAETTGAVAVICLAFPLQPPQRAGSKPAASRMAELEAVRVPTLVVQGAHDRFGIPAPGHQRTVIEVQADHSLRTDRPALATAVQSWLADLLAQIAPWPQASVS